MSLYKFNSHPQPGYYDKDGQFITFGDQIPVGRVKTKSAVTASSYGGAGGVGSGGGGGGSFSDGMSSAAGVNHGSSSANVDRYNSVRDRLEEGTVLEDWIPRDAAGLDKMFRLMYHRDPIAGTIVDLLCDLIWSEFDLTGIKDPAIKRIFMDSLEAIDPVATMPDITREFLVLGRTISSLIFDSTTGIFRDVVSHDPDFIRLSPIPIKGFDPKIDLIPSPTLRMFIDSQDPRDVDARRVLPDAYIKAIRAASGNGGGGGGGFNYGGGSNRTAAMGGGGIPLDPVNTLFIARKVFNYDTIGTSLYTRMISFWALEKALINATLTSARRRSRSILHAKIGIDNVWEPSAEEIDNIAGLFIQADDDPVGAVVATRTGVDVNEVRQGNDFYKWSDEWQLLTEGKMRALGANDALLSGEATYSNQENAKLFFMEKAQALRAQLTQRTFYSRLFPLIARIHGFRKRSQAQLDHGIRIGDKQAYAKEGADVKLTQREALSIPDSELIVPTIAWRKELTYNVDDKRMEVYEKMEEKGVPVTLRNWASAANIDLDSQFSDLDQDAQLRKRAQKWKGEYENATDLAEQEAKLEFVKSLQNIAHSRVQQVVGSAAPALGPIGSYVFWSREATLGGLKATELADFLKTIDPNTNSVLILADSNALHFKLNQHFKDECRAEIAQYLMYRTGLITYAPVLSEKTMVILNEQIASALDQYSSEGSVYQLGKVAQQELKLIAGLSRQKKASALDKVEKAAKSVYKPAAVDTTPSNSKFLYSGKSK